MRALVQDLPERDGASGGEAVKFVSLLVPEPYLEKLEDLVRKRYYPNRSEAIRMVIRDMVKDEWQKEK